MNKRRIILIAIIIIFAFSAIELFSPPKSKITIDNKPTVEKSKTITTKNADGTTTTQVIKENSESQEELKFYDNVVDAVRNCTYSDQQYEDFSEDDILALMENEHTCIVLAKMTNANGYGNDVVEHYKLKKKNENGKAIYSRPVCASQTFWKAHKIILHGYGSIKIEMNLKDKIVQDLNNCSGTVIDFFLDSENGLTRWGMADDERLLNLKINGVTPTKVIETKMDGDTVYFWYYEHLEVDLNNTENINIEF